MLRGSNDGQMRADVAALCRRLMDARRPVEIEPVRAADAAGRMFSIIERIDRDGIVISRPSGPGAHRSLIAFASYTLVLPDGARAIAVDVKMLARTKLKGGQNSTLFCYKVSLPTNPREIARSDEQRSLVGADMSCEATIRAIGHAQPMFGVIERLTPGEVMIRCRTAVALPAGASVHIDAALPHPVGDLAEVGAISSIEPGKDAQGPLLHVKFLEPVERIANALAERRKAG